MQKSMRYHIADGENQPVVRAVALVVQREEKDPQNQPERTQPVTETEQHPQGNHAEQDDDRHDRAVLRSLPRGTLDCEAAELTAITG